MEERYRKLTPALEAEHRHLKRMLDQAQDDHLGRGLPDSHIKLHMARRELKEFVARLRAEGFYI